jgi:hypothetical protein
MTIWKKTDKVNKNKFEDLDRLPEVGDSIFTKFQSNTNKKAIYYVKNKNKTERCNGELGVYFARTEKGVENSFFLS